MEEAMHFLDELKDKYLHQVEQAIEDWDYQDFSPDKRCALLENEEEHNERDDPEENRMIKPIPKAMRKAWVGLTPDAELEDFDCGQTSAANISGYEAKLVALCTPPGGIQSVPDADSIGNKNKKKTPKPSPAPVKQQLSPGKLAVDRVFRPELKMSKSTALLVQQPKVSKPSLVVSPKVSQAVQASWRRRNSVAKDQEDGNLMPYQKIPAVAPRNSWIYGTPAKTGGVQSSITTSSRFDSGN
eukprot:jgi/Phyca11/510468/fgenesh2_kg.PHYCAscaffold_61_\